MDFETLEVKRFTIHKIFSRKDLKSKKMSDPYAEVSENLCELDDDGLETLNRRIKTVAFQARKFFELDLEETGIDSFWSIARGIFNNTRKQYIATANKIADKAAEAHSKGSIPGGLLLVVECNLGKKDCLVVIKAERSNAFSLSGSNMELVKDLFLSTDKTLYKIAFLVKTGNKDIDPSSYKCFVYDDSFSAIKEDLAYYFYHSFLGFSTEKNSKIQTNNFYKYISRFTEKFIEGFGDQNNIMKAVDNDMLSNRKKIIHPDDYKSYFPDELQDEYERYITDKLPRAIVKDISILSDIRSKRIKINEDAVLLAKNDIGKDVLILDEPTITSLETAKRTILDTGKKYKVVFIPMAKAEKPADKK